MCCKILIHGSPTLQLTGLKGSAAYCLYLGVRHHSTVVSTVPSELFWWHMRDLHNIMLVVVMLKLIREKSKSTFCAPQTSGDIKLFFCLIIGPFLFWKLDPQTHLFFTHLASLLTYFLVSCDGSGTCQALQEEQIDVIKKNLIFQNNMLSIIIKNIYCIYIFCVAQ